MPTNVTLNIPPLPDNAVWWANNAAWQAYWANGNFSIDINPATTVDYGVVMTATTIVYNAPDTSSMDYVNFVVDGVNNIVPSQTNFDQLKAAFITLLTDYQVLKTALKTSGAISNA